MEPKSVTKGYLDVGRLQELFLFSLVMIFQIVSTTWVIWFPFWRPLDF